MIICVQPACRLRWPSTLIGKPANSAIDERLFTALTDDMLDDIFKDNTFDILPHLVPLTAAYLLAFPIGWDREREERSAGLRTFPLVAVASCGFIEATETVLNGHPEGTARVVEGLITGMGFIGGGAILRLKDSVKGTATAASLWATGAIGTAVGLGAYDIAILLSLATIITLRALVPLKRGTSSQDAIVDPDRIDDGQDR